MRSFGKGWPRGGGEIGELLRHPAFEAVGLGPPESWPASLKHIAEMVLNSRQPKFVAWGPDLAFLYNDAYVPVFPERHPAALGRPFREVWADIWEQFSPIVASTLSGSPQLFKELRIPMRRDGRTEDTWFTFSYTPLRDDDGTIAGILCATLDVTDQVAAKRGEKLALEELRAKSEALAVVNRAGAAITVEPDVERLTQIVVDAGVTLTGAEFGAFFYNVDSPASTGGISKSSRCRATPRSSRRPSTAKVSCAPTISCSTRATGRARRILACRRGICRSGAILPCR